MRHKFRPAPGKALASSQSKVTTVRDLSIPVKILYAVNLKKENTFSDKCPWKLHRS